MSTSACWHSTNERSMQIDQLFAERHAFPTADFASVIVLELIAASVADHPTCAPTNLRRCCSMCPTTADSSVPLHATRCRCCALAGSAPERRRPVSRA